MRHWCRATESEYRRLDLRAHGYLTDAPVHDVWRVSLPGSDRRCSMAEVRPLLQAVIADRSHPVVRALFALRRLLGRVFRWDHPPADVASWSLRPRLADADRGRSLVTPGTADGPFTVVYVHPAEAVSEIRNATVHSVVVWAIAPAPGGHDLFLAVHVRPVGLWTRPYLALIEPFRRWIVYPWLLSRVHDGWSHGLGSP